MVIVLGLEWIFSVSGLTEKGGDVVCHSEFYAINSTKLGQDTIGFYGTDFP